MKELDIILEDCLEQILLGASSLDECLARYPEHAAQLRPLLKAALRVQEGRLITPSYAFKDRTRAQVMAHARGHPRAKPRTFLWQVALSMALMVVAFLVVGTAFAQRSLPGERLYAWKLNSESAWRSVSPDPLAVDLKIANRRVNEMMAVSGDDVRVVEALDGYRMVLLRFQSNEEAVNQERIVPVLAGHRDRLAQAGLLIPELDNYFLVDNQIDGAIPPAVEQPATPEPASH